MSRPRITRKLSSYFVTGLLCLFGLICCSKKTLVPTEDILTVDMLRVRYPDQAVILSMGNPSVDDLRTHSGTVALWFKSPINDTFGDIHVLLDKGRIDSVTEMFGEFPKQATLLKKSSQVNSIESLAPLKIAYVPGDHMKYIARTLKSKADADAFSGAISLSFDLDHETYQYCHFSCERGRIVRREVKIDKHL